MKFVIIPLLAVMSALAQPAVSLSTGPPPAPFVNLFDYDGSGNLIYRGIAPAFLQANASCVGGGSTCIQRSDSTLTSVVVATNVATVTCSSACGAWVGMRMIISGCTTAAVNGTFTVLSAPTATTYTLAITVADGTYNNAAMAINTNYPLTTQSVWEIQVSKFNGSSQVIATVPANASVGTNLAWTNRATY